MTVTATNIYSALVGNGVTTAFPFTFAAASASEVKVSLAGVVQNGGFTVAVSSTGTGGTVTFDTAPANGVAVLIESDPLFTQAATFAGEGDFNPLTFDRVHDRLTAYVLWLKARVSALFPFSFPDIASRSGKFLGFDAGGNGVLLSGTGNDSALRTDLAAGTGAALAGFLPTGAGGVSTTVAAAVRARGVAAQEFGVTVGSSDSAAALQLAINAAAANGVPLLLPGGQVTVNSLVDLKGRAISIEGVKGASIIKAGAAMAVLMDCTETTEQSVPLKLSGFTLDGNNVVTNANLSIRYRREHIVEDLRSYNAVRGIRLKDANSGTLRRVRTASNTYGLHSEGSNHATHHDACEFLQATTTAVLIENNGTAADGNNALAFTACVTQDGAANCYDLASGCSADLNACYIGENQSAENLVNRGGLLKVNGGVLYFGHASQSYIHRPIGGSTIVRGSLLFSQDASRGLEHYSYLAPGEIGTNGVFEHHACQIAHVVSGNPTLEGDVLARVPGGTVFAPRLGKQLTSTVSNATVTNALASDVNGRIVTWASTTGASPQIGLSAALLNQNWRDGEPMSLIIVYRASQAVTVQLRTAAWPGGASVVAFGSLPARSALGTWIKVDINASSSAQATLDMFMPATSGADFLDVRGVWLCDSSCVNGGAVNRLNLFKAS